MRVLTQLVFIGVLGAAGYGGWHYWQAHQADAAKANAPAQARSGGPSLAVEVLAVRLGTVVEKTEAVGTARANESVTITAKQTGNVAIVAFEEGQLVKTGQSLIELETRERRAEVDQAKNELEQARAQRDDARQKLDRSRQLRGTGSVTQARLDELDMTLRGGEARVRGAEARIRMLDARLDDVRITAPFDGRVGMRQVSIGALVQPGVPITTLDDLSRIKMDFSVPENVLGRLREGLPVFARSSAFPNRVFEGRVQVVDTRVDPVTRAVRVIAMFDNSDEALKPGLFVNIELALAKRENALMIAEEALVPEGPRQFVFAVREGRAIRVEVKLGTRLQGEVEVVEGLKAGEQVVVRGTSRVRHNQPVTTKPLQKPTS